jgi:hypothetical protein
MRRPCHFPVALVDQGFRSLGWGNGWHFWVRLWMVPLEGRQGFFFEKKEAKNFLLLSRI